MTCEIVDRARVQAMRRALPVGDVGCPSQCFEEVECRPFTAQGQDPAVTEGDKRQSELLSQLEGIEITQQHREWGTQAVQKFTERLRETDRLNNFKYSSYATSDSPEAAR